VQSVTYTILYLLSAGELAFGGNLYNLFRDNLQDDFGRQTHAIVVIIYVFALLTVLGHQFFIYHSLHNMDDHPQKWKKDFDNWYGTLHEKIVRIIAFVVLLMGVGKIFFVEWICECYVHRFYNSKQMLIVGSSILLFAVLTYWDYKAARKCKNYKFLLSDALALVFWLTFAIPYFTDSGHLGILAVLPLLIMLVYCIAIGVRIVNYVGSLNQKVKSE
jgi:hypothetical protein